MGLGLLVLSILCLIARCCWRPSRYKCVDHALNVLAAVFLYFVLLGVLVRQNPVTVIESALVRPIMRSRPRFILSIGFLQVLFFLTNDSTWRVSAYWSGILNLQKKTWIGRFSAEKPVKNRRFSWNRSSCPKALPPSWVTSVGSSHTFGDAKLDILGLLLGSPQRPIEAEDFWHQLMQLVAWQEELRRKPVWEDGPVGKMIT